MTKASKNTPPKALTKLTFDKSKAKIIKGLKDVVTLVESQVFADGTAASLVTERDKLQGLPGMIQEIESNTSALRKGINARIGELRIAEGRKSGQPTKAEVKALLDRLALLEAQVGQQDENQ